jgi:hypothetical protein
MISRSVMSALSSGRSRTLAVAGHCEDDGAPTKPPSTLGDAAAKAPPLTVDRGVNLGGPRRSTRPRYASATPSVRSTTSAGFGGSIARVTIQIEPYWSPRPEF